MTLIYRVPCPSLIGCCWVSNLRASNNQSKATTNQTRCTDLCEPISSVYSFKSDPRRFLYQERTVLKRKKAVYLVNLGKLISKSEIVWFLLQLIYRDKLTGSDNNNGRETLFAKVNVCATPEEPRHAINFVLASSKNSGIFVILNEARVTKQLKKFQLCPVLCGIGSQIATCYAPRLNEYS